MAKRNHRSELWMTPCYDLPLATGHGSLAGPGRWLICQRQLDIEIFGMVDYVVGMSFLIQNLEPRYRYGVQFNDHCITGFVFESFDRMFHHAQCVQPRWDWINRSPRQLPVLKSYSSSRKMLLWLAGTQAFFHTRHHTINKGLSTLGFGSHILEASLSMRPFFFRNSAQSMCPPPCIDWHEQSGRTPGHRSCCCWIRMWDVVNYGKPNRCHKDHQKNTHLHNI